MFVPADIADGFTLIVKHPGIKVQACLWIEISAPCAGAVQHGQFVTKDSGVFELFKDAPRLDLIFCIPPNHFAVIKIHDEIERRLAYNLNHFGEHYVLLSLAQRVEQKQISTIKPGERRIPRLQASWEKADSGKSHPIDRVRTRDRFHFLSRVNVSVVGKLGEFVSKNIGAN